MAGSNLILPVNPSLQDLIFIMLASVYGLENITETLKLGDTEFIAALEGTVFELADTPDKIDVNRVNSALINHYTVEIIYFVPGNVRFVDRRIVYRHIAEYLPLLGGKTDLIRLINEARNRRENESRSKTKKTSQSLDKDIQLCARAARR